LMPCYPSDLTGNRPFINGVMSIRGQHFKGIRRTTYE
jgi:hypothetical protein